jgi:hypothetical protein
MTKTEEQKFVVLLTIWELGGSAPKWKVLDRIESQKYYQFDHRDLQWMENRNELTWRNDLSFARKRLESEDYIDGSVRDNWEITEEGIVYFKNLCKQVAVCSSFEKLSPSAKESAVKADAVS